MGSRKKERGAVAVGVWNLVGWAGRLNACHLEAPRRGLIRVGGLVDWSRLWCRIVDGPRGGVAQKTWERTGQPRLGIEYRIGPLSRGEERASLPLLAAVFHTLDVSANRLPCRGARACGWTTGRSSEVGVERGRDDDLWMRGARTGWKRHRAETETGERPETERDK